MGIARIVLHLMQHFIALQFLEKCNEEKRKEKREKKKKKRWPLAVDGCFRQWDHHNCDGEKNLLGGINDRWPNQPISSPWERKCLYIPSPLKMGLKWSVPSYVPSLSLSPLSAVESHSRRWFPSDGELIAEEMTNATSLTSSGTYFSDLLL